MNHRSLLSAWSIPVAPVAVLPSAYYTRLHTIHSNNCTEER